MQGWRNARSRKCAGPQRNRSVRRETELRQSFEGPPQGWGHPAGFAYDGMRGHLRGALAAGSRFCAHSQVGDQMVASSDEDFARIPYTVRTARLISSPLSARTARCMPISVNSATRLDGRNLFISPRNALAVDSIANSS